MAKRDVELHRGLTGIYLDRTASSFIDGTAGKLLYRGYNINDLAVQSTLEEVVYLLLYGQLPTRSQLQEMDDYLRSNRELPPEIYTLIDTVKAGHPMDVLRTAISALGALDPETTDNSVEATRRKGLRLTAQAPTIVCAHHRLRQGKDVVAPSTHLGHAANFLYMFYGTEPDPEEAPPAGHGLHHPRRARLERVGLRRTGGGLDAGGPALGGGVGHRHAQGPAARRGRRGRDAHGQGDRRAGAGCRVRSRRAGGRRTHHGLRPPGVQGGGPAGQPDEGPRTGPGRAARRAAMVPDPPGAGGRDEAVPGPGAST